MNTLGALRNALVVLPCSLLIPLGLTSATSMRGSVKSVDQGARTAVRAATCTAKTPVNSKHSAYGQQCRFPIGHGRGAHTSAVTIPKKQLYLWRASFSIMSCPGKLEVRGPDAVAGHLMPLTVFYAEDVKEIRAAQYYVDAALAQGGTFSLHFVPFCAEKGFPDSQASWTIRISYILLYL